MNILGIGQDRNWRKSLLFSCIVMSNSVWPHGLQHSRLPCPSPSPRVCLNSCPFSHWYHPTTSSSVTSCPQSFLPSESFFPVSEPFTSLGQSIGASTLASVLPVNIQGWFPLRLTGLISMLSKRLSRVFSSSTVQKHQFIGVSLLYGPILTSIHDYWKNHSFDYMNLCWQSDISAF